ncbi:competence type IV pilus minor pilin ComGF [Lacticaseibacillus manihotivorans]|uniref:competence type IV pilus minor pilin ComGF n=1 Tax=Lacticaseibacillus manihotivorans TaxID=88233 RepID=UPI0034E1A42B
MKNYSGKSGDLLIFTRANNEGYEPVLTDVAAVAWTEVDHAVKYTVTMKSGRIYEGVIVDGEKAR